VPTGSGIWAAVPAVRNVIAVGKAQPRPLAMKVVVSATVNLVMEVPGVVNAKMVIGEHR